MVKIYVCVRLWFLPGYVCIRQSQLQRGQRPSVRAVRHAGTLLRGVSFFLLLPLLRSPLVFGQEDVEVGPSAGDGSAVGQGVSLKWKKNEMSCLCFCWGSNRGSGCSLCRAAFTSKYCPCMVSLSTLPATLEGNQPSNIWFSKHLV